MNLNNNNNDNEVRKIYALIDSGSDVTIHFTRIPCVKFPFLHK